MKSRAGIFTIVAWIVVCAACSTLLGFSISDGIEAAGYGVIGGFVGFYLGSLVARVERR